MASGSNVSHLLRFLLGLKVCTRQSQIGVVRLRLRVVNSSFNLRNAFLRALWFHICSEVGRQIDSLNRGLAIRIWGRDYTARSGSACIHPLLLFKGGSFLFRGQFTVFGCGTGAD